MWPRQKSKQVGRDRVAKVGRGAGSGRGGGLQWSWPWRRWRWVCRRRSRSLFLKRWRRKRKRRRRLREQEVEKRAPSRPVGWGQLRPYQDLHSFIITSSRWKEVKAFRKESEKRSISKLSIYTEVVCSTVYFFDFYKLQLSKSKALYVRGPGQTKKSWTGWKGKLFWGVTTSILTDSLNQ